MYYALYKTRGSKTWGGAIPARKGVSKVRFKKALRMKLRRNQVFRIINRSQLKRYIKSKLIRKKWRK